MGPGARVLHGPLILPVRPLTMISYSIATNYCHDPHVWTTPKLSVIKLRRLIFAIIISQSGHRHHPTHQMTMECLSMPVLSNMKFTGCTLHERYTWRDRNHTYPKRQ